MRHTIASFLLIGVGFFFNDRIHAQGNPPPDQADAENEETEPTKEDKPAGDPVLLATGNLKIAETDLHIPGRGGLDVEILRTYRNGTSIESALGPKWDLNWFKRIVVFFADCGTNPTRMYYYDGETRMDVIDRNPWDPNRWDMPLGQFSKIRFTDPVGGGFNPPNLEVRMADGTLYTFGVPSKSLWVGGCTTSYWLSRVQDRMGNTIDLEYQTVGTFPNVYSRLWRIIDTYGRPITLDYASTAPTARLVSITDFAGRSVRYGRDGFERLTTATTPNVDDALSVSLGNAFPSGKTTTYQYMNDDLLSPQRFNVTRVIDPRGFTYLENQYSAPSGSAGEGRVVSQIVGGTNDSGVAAGGKYLFFYDMPALPIEHGPGHDDWSYFWRQRGRTLVVSPNGNASLTVFDSGWGDFLTYQFTGRVNPNDSNLLTSSIDSLVQMELNESEDEALDPNQNMLAPWAPSYTSSLHGSSDPNAFITVKFRDFHGLVTEVQGPGSHFRYTYNNDYIIQPWLTSTPDRLQQGNMLKSEQLTNDPEDTSDPIVTLYLYEPIFNQLRAIVDPRGNDPDFAPPNGGSNSPQRYMTRYLFDYQELDWNSSAIQTGLLSNWSIDEQQGYQFGVTGYLLPAMPSDDNQPDLNGDGPTGQPRGNVLQRVDPATNVPVDIASATLSFTPQQRICKYVFNSFSLVKSATDAENHLTTYSYYPAGTPTGGAPSTDGGGLLAETQLPQSIVQRTEYDVLGRRVREINGRGFGTDYVYNALDRLIRRTDADGTALTNLYDGNDNIVEVRTASRRPQLSPTTGLPDGTTVDLGEIKDFFKFDVLDRMVEEDRQAGAGNRMVTRYRYDKEGNRVLTLLPEFVAGSDPANVRARTFDERNLVLTDAQGGLGYAFRDTSYINQAHSAVLAELGGAVIDLPSAELAETYEDYSLHGDPVSHYDGESRTWEMGYDGFNRLRYRITPGPYGSTSKLIRTDTLDPAGNAEKSEFQNSTGALLGTTRCYFDEGRRKYQEDQDFFSVGSGVVPVDGPLNPSDDKVNRRWLFDKDGRIVQTIDDNRSRRYLVYDGLDRLTLVSDHPDVIGTAKFGIQYTYDKNSNVILTEETERRASDGVITYFRSWDFFDKLDRRTARVNNLRHTDRFLYDSRSNLVFQSDAVSADLSALLPSLDVFGEHTGLPNQTINGHGNATVFEFDDASRPTVERRFGAFVGGQIVVSKSYDKNGRLKTQVDDKGNATAYDYDAINRPKKTTFGDATVSEVLDYDRNHHVKELRDQNGTDITFGYDDAGRLTQKTIFPGPGVAGTPGQIETYQYDALGRLIMASDDDSTVARFYDSLSNVVREDLTHSGLTRSTISKHDGVGNLVDVTYPGGRSVQRTFDEWNRLTVVQSEGIDVARYSYIGLHRVQDKQLYGVGSGGQPMATATLTYDNIRRVKSVKHVRTQDQFTIDHRSLTYNRERDKLSREDEVTQVLHEYDYDAVHRMYASHRSVVGQPGSPLERTITYTLDDVGNRQQVQTGTQTDTYTMNSADSPVNQYTNTPPGKWFHDENGSLVRIKPPGPVIARPDGWTNQFNFAYDYRNQLVQVWNPTTSTTSQYSYDALGRRIRKTVNGQSTRYFYVDWEECEEQDSSGATVATYVYGRVLDEVLTMRRSVGGTPTNYVYHSDDLGNVMKLTNAATGAVVESYDYDDYGGVLNGSSLASMPQGSAVGNPILFAGRRYDAETRLYYVRHRYLDPSSGRFIARDPIGIWGDAGNLGSGYAYCGNNPWSFKDPMGLEKGGGSGECACCGGPLDASGSCNCCADGTKGQPKEDPPKPPDPPVNPPKPNPPPTQPPTNPPPVNPPKPPDVRGNDPELPLTNPDGTPNMNHPANQIGPIGEGLANTAGLFAGAADGILPFSPMKSLGNMLYGKGDPAWSEMSTGPGYQAGEVIGEGLMIAKAAVAGAARTAANYAASGYNYVEGAASRFTGAVGSRVGSALSSFWSWANSPGY